MAVEALARLDSHRVLFGIEHDAILDKVERECATCGAGPVERGKRAIERAEPVRADRQGREAIARCLDLFIGEPRRRAHQRAPEAVAQLAAGGVDPQMHRVAGAIFARHQRTQPVRQRLRQHRHDAVGKIDRIAARCRLAVERAVRGDVERDIGDRDDEMPAARIGRVGIGLGPHSIVEIARVAAVDCDQRHVAQIDAAGGLGRFSGGGLGQCRRGKLGRDAEGGDRQETDRAGSVGQSQSLDDAQPRRTVTPNGEGFGGDQFAIHCAAGLRQVDKIFVAVATIRRRHPPAVADAVEDPDDAV